MVVEFNEFIPPDYNAITIRKTDWEAMKQVRGWLAKVMPRQPDRNSTGAVVPRVKVSFIRFVDSERKTESENFLVYRVKDSKSVVELVSESEIAELRRIIE